MLAPGKKNRFSGDLFLLSSQVIFLICGYGIQVIITRFLSPTDYGTWGVLTAVLVWFELTIISGFPKGVTKFIAESPLIEQDEVFFRSYLVQLLVGLVLGAVLFGVAHPLAALWDTADLRLLLQISALDIPLYGLYFENMAVLNGKHQFRKMFFLQAFYSIAKLTLIIVLVASGFGLEGAAWGNVLASLAACLVSQTFVGLPKIPAQKNFYISRLIAFCIPSTLFVVLFALIQRADFLMLKTLTSLPRILGFYWAAQLLARVPYFLIEGTSKKLFSLLSESYGHKDWQTARISFSEYMHLTFLIFGLVVSVTLGCANDIILLLFPKDYEQIAHVLRILIVVNSLTALMYIFSQVLFSVSQEKKALGGVSLLVLLSGTLCWILIPWKGEYGAAGAALITFFLGSVLFYRLLPTQLKGGFDIRFTAKLLIAGTLTVIIGWILPTGTIPLILLKLTAVTLLYALSLFALREPMALSAIRMLRRRNFYEDASE